MESEDDQEVEAVIKTVLVKAPSRCVRVMPMFIRALEGAYMVSVYVC